MNPLASLHHCLDLHPLPAWSSAIQVAEQGGEAEALATRAEYAAMRARTGPLDNAEEVTLRVLGCACGGGCRVGSRGKGQRRRIGTRRD